MEHLCYTSDVLWRQLIFSGFFSIPCAVRATIAYRHNTFSGNCDCGIKKFCPFLSSAAPVALATEILT
jgi:hypothetical protein